MTFPELFKQGRQDVPQEHRVYVDNPVEDAPKGVHIYIGPNGGMYYDRRQEPEVEPEPETDPVESPDGWVELAEDNVITPEDVEQYAYTDEATVALARAVKEGDIGEDQVEDHTKLSNRFADVQHDGVISSSEYQLLRDAMRTVWHKWGESKYEPGSISDFLLDKQDEWVRYEGPQGGQGWRNTHTGEIRYQDEKPAPEEGSPGEGYDQWQNIAQEMLDQGVDPQEVAERLRAEAQAAVAGHSHLSPQEANELWDYANEILGQEPEETPEDIQTVEEMSQMPGGIDKTWAKVEDLPEEVDPSRAVEAGSLEDFGIPTGWNNEAMTIAVMPEGHKLFISNAERVEELAAAKGGHPNQGARMMATTYSLEEIKNQLEGTAYDNWKFPEAVWNPEIPAWLTKEVEGDNLAEVPNDAADPDSLLNALAIGFITGNFDLHEDNVMVDEDGQVILVDNDGGGGVTTSGPDRVPNKAIQSLTYHTEYDGLSKAEAEKIVWERAVEIANHIDRDGVKEHVTAHDDQHEVHEDKWGRYRRKTYLNLKKLQRAEKSTVSPIWDEGLW